MSRSKAEALRQGWQPKTGLAAPGVKKHGVQATEISPGPNGERRWVAESSGRANRSDGQDI